MPPFLTDAVESPSDDSTETPVRAATDFTPIGYDRGLIATVWDYAEMIEGNDPDLWRKDEFGAWLYRHDYGRRNSDFGWEICDLNAGRGSSGVAALRPMQWQNYLDQIAALTRSRVTADGLRNARKLL